MKHSIKKIIALVMLVSVFVTCFAVIANAVTDSTGSYTFTYSGSNATITQKLTTSTDALVFPDTVNYSSKTYTVTALDSGFFTNSKSKTQYATSVKFPAGLTSIAQGTFNSYVSYITYIEIPGASTNCSDFFMGCSRLTQFIVNENNPNLKAIDGVLFKYSSTNTIIQRFPAAKKLESGTTYEIPDGMTLIAYYAFYGSKYITDVKVPASVTTIRPGAFCESNITGVHLADGTTYDPSTYTCYCASSSTKKCADRLQWCIEDEQEALDPVCGTPGHTSGLRCDITGEWLTGEEIPAVGEHTWNLTGTTEATCTEDTVSSFLCSECSATKEEVLADSALGHTGGTATCKQLAVCNRCTQSYGSYDYNNHLFTDYSLVWSEATCKDNKKMYATCDYGCGLVDTIDVEDTKLPHGETTTAETKIPATCLTDGYHTVTTKCKECSTVLDTTTTLLPALGHAETEPVKGNEIPATCEEDGSYTLTVNCERCDLAEIETVTVPALGHSDNNSDYSCDACSEKLHNPADDCNHMCHKDGIMGFIWKVVRFFQKLIKRNPICECGVAHY